MYIYIYYGNYALKIFCVSEREKGKARERINQTVARHGVK